MFKYDYSVNNKTYILKFAIGICYDMHFPEVVLAYALQGCHAIFTPHASPLKGEKRLNMWNKYLSARAYDNRLYILACNLIGYNEKKQFGGGLGVWNYKGDLVNKLISNQEDMIISSINCKEIEEIKVKNSSMKNSYFLKDRQKELYKGYLY